MVIVGRIYFYMREREVFSGMALPFGWYNLLQYITFLVIKLKQLF